MFDASRYLAYKEKAAKAPLLQVSKEEFIRVLMEAGSSAKEAETQARISHALNSEVLIGDKLYQIKTTSVFETPS